MGKLIFNAQSTPVAPVGENKHTMFVDSADGQLKIEDNCGNICSFSAADNNNNIIIPNSSCAETPASGTSILFVDACDGKLKYKDANGTVYRLTTNMDGLKGCILIVGGGGSSGNYKRCGTGTSPATSWECNTGGGGGGQVCQYCGVTLPMSACVVIGAAGAAGGWAGWNQSCNGNAGGTTCFGSYSAVGGCGSCGNAGGAGAGGLTVGCNHHGGGACTSATNDKGGEGCTTTITPTGTPIYVGGGGGKYGGNCNCGSCWANCPGCGWDCYGGGGNPTGWGGTQTGHDGVVIVRYSDTTGICATGGTVTCCSGYITHVFTSNGTFCILCVN